MYSVIFIQYLLSTVFLSADNVALNKTADILEKGDRQLASQQINSIIFPRAVCREESKTQQRPSL